MVLKRGKRYSIGVSWQVVPMIMAKLMQDTDPAKSKRVMEAMLKMKKLDIQKLKDAHSKG